MDLTFHGTDNQLENYALGRLPDSELPLLEEHLLVCEGCRERLDLVEQFALGLREEHLANAARNASGARSWLSALGTSWIRRPAFSMGFGFVALIAGLLIFSNGRAHVATAAALQLTAMRGEMPFAVPARETNLTLTDAPTTTGHFRIEVLDGTGRSVWSGRADSTPKGAKAKVQRQLTPGDYFVRLYDSGGNVIHEYGFRVRQ